MSAPHKMGAALTYARRYALFTLVGIAGEDLDAPELLNGTVPAIDPALLETKGAPFRKNPRPAAPALPPDQSATLRDRLLGEVADLQSTDAAASWARDGITAKNRLAAADAKLVEEAFELRLLEFSQADAEDRRGPGIATQVPATTAQPIAPGTPENDGAGGVDKSVLTVAEPRRYRNKEHLRFVAQQACLVCGRKLSDPHHLRFTQPRALGRKVSDEFVVPLCRIHHREVHRVGDERAWWKQAGIDPVMVAGNLWRSTRPNGDSLRPGSKTEPTGMDVSLQSSGAAGKAPA